FLTKTPGLIERWRLALNELGYQVGSTFGKIAETLSKNVVNLFDDPAFQSASFSGKAALFWERVIVQPFSAWWEAGGRKSFTAALPAGGGLLGEATATTVLAMLGLGVGADANRSAIVEAGAKFGEAFSAGVMRATNNLGGRLLDQLEDDLTARGLYGLF